MSLAFARKPFIAKSVSLIAAAYLLYLIVVVLVVVPAINGLAPIVFKQQTGRTLQFADITVNPFTLAVSLEHARNDNPDGTPFFFAETLRADLALKSLWSELTLDEVAVRGLQLNIAQTDAEHFNFSDILDYRRQHAGEAPPAAKNAATHVTPIAINSLHIDTGTIAFRAPQQATPMTVRVDKFALDIDDLNTRDSQAADAKSSLPAVALRRAQLAIARADIELPRPSSTQSSPPFKTHIANVQGGLELFSTRDVDAQPFTLALDDESGGHIKTTGQVSLATAQSRGDIDIKNLSLLPAWRYLAQQLHFDLDQGKLSLAGTFDVNWKDALRYRAQIRSTQLDDLRMRARDDADSAVDLGKLAVANIQLDSATRHVQIGSSAIDALHVRGWNRDTQISLLDMFKFDSPADDAPPSAPWSLQLDAFALGSSATDSSRIDWRTDSIDLEQLAITPLRVNVQNLHWPDAQTANLSAALAINDNTTLDLKGAVIPATQSGNVEGDLKGLPLAWGNRVIAQRLTANITSGVLHSHFTAMLEQGQPQQLTSDGTVDNFQLLRNGITQPVAAWQQVQWQRLNVDIPQQVVQIERIDFNKPQARFRINPDGTNNFQEMVIKQTASTKKPPAPKNSVATDNKNTAPAAADKPWKTTVDLIHIQDGTLDFRDNSLPRPFRAVIGNFTGNIAELGSAPNQVARIDLQGNVDGYAPVTLTGTAAPLRAQPALNLALDFTNLDLATLTSYSGTYAGYAINRGLLTLQLSYKLEDNRLQGQNRIVITRMELGDKVASPKAVDLPLRLAIALLTDENGVIDLGVGVEGDLDNPQFSVRGIIWKALRNVIVKAVTSPFRLLASLVGGSETEDLGVIDFDAGTDHIDAASRERMGKLVQALAKRPALQLRVIGHADPVADATAMKQGKLDYFLTQDGVDDQDFQEHNNTWRKAVTKLYEKTFPEQEVGEQTPEQLMIALRDSMTLGADAMDFIAARRALAAKRVLVVELGLATDRVLIDAAPADKVASNRTQAELKVDL